MKISFKQFLSETVDELTPPYSGIIKGLHTDFAKQHYNTARLQRKYALRGVTLPDVVLHDTPTREYLKGPNDHFSVIMHNSENSHIDKVNDVVDKILAYGGKKVFFDKPTGNDLESAGYEQTRLRFIDRDGSKHQFYIASTVHATDDDDTPLYQHIMSASKSNVRWKEDQ